MTLEDQIRNLCTQLLAAQDDEEIQKLVAELKTAIHDHCADLKVMATVSYPRSGKTSDPQERWTTAKEKPTRDVP